MFMIGSPYRQFGGLRAGRPCSTVKHVRSGLENQRPVRPAGTGVDWNRANQFRIVLQVLPTLLPSQVVKRDPGGDAESPNAKDLGFPQMADLPENLAGDDLQNVVGV